jgi:ribosomal protein S26
MEFIIEWHRVHYICLSLTHLNVHIDKGSIHVKVCRNTSRTFPHSWLVARITRRVPLVEQKLLTLPEDMSSPPVFSVVRVTRSLVLCACFFRSLFVLLYFFLLIIVLSVLLRYTDYGCLPLVSSNSSNRIYLKKVN